MQDFMFSPKVSNFYKVRKIILIGLLNKKKLKQTKNLNRV